MKADLEQGHQVGDKIQRHRAMFPQENREKKHAKRHKSQQLVLKTWHFECHVSPANAHLSQSNSFIFTSVHQWINNVVSHIVWHNIKYSQSSCNFHVLCLRFLFPVPPSTVPLLGLQPGSILYWLPYVFKAPKSTNFHLNLQNHSCAHYTICQVNILKRCLIWMFNI